MTLELFEKHPGMDAYRVGGAYQPYAVVAVDKRFSDAELVAEYWVSTMHNLWNADRGNDEHLEVGRHRASALLRFCTLPHASDTNYE